MQGNLLVLFVEGLEAATPPGYSARERQQWRSLTRRCCFVDACRYHKLVSFARGRTSFGISLPYSVKLGNVLGSLSNHRVFSAFEPETVMLQGAVNCSHFLPGSAAAITVPPDRRKPQCA